MNVYRKRQLFFIQCFGTLYKNYGQIQHIKPINSYVQLMCDLMFICSLYLEQQMRKFLNNRHTTEADYEVKCLQHLQHDFKVQQYLRETTSIHNHQSYVNLLNQIAFNNKNKKRHIKYLKHQTRCFTVQNQQPCISRMVQGKDNDRWTDLMDFEKKIIEEQQIKNHLLSQLNEVSKSINLMKGDVSRIIEKNQSTIVLQNKTSKVKLIAQDQLKKVNLALNKDHSQILQRNNMQIRFNKKLKNICNNENNILKKIQCQYLRLEKRKKLINEKIRKMEDIMKNLNEREKTREEIKIVNERNRINLEEIMNLFDLVKKIETQCEGKEEEEKDETLLDTHLSLKTQRFKLKVKQIQSQIIKYISQLTHSIEKSDKQFRTNTEKAYEYKNKLEQIDQQLRISKNMLYSGRDNVISEQQMRNYDHKLTQFKKSLNGLMVIWQFIENHQQFTRLIDQYQNESLRSSKKQSSPSRFYRKSEQYQKNISIVNEDNNYSNKFYKLILFLTDNGQEINLQSEFLMKSLQMTIIMWLKGLKNLILEEEKLQDPDKLKKAKSSEGLKFKSTIELIEQMGEVNHIKYRLSFGQQEEDKLKTMLQLISPKKTTIFSLQHNKTNFNHKQTKTEGNEQCKAQRIKVLEKVEYDYYKMLKNVLQIEKENIKKNYDFNKNFNRAKFTQKNILQQQKRFQSNFALEFIRKSEQSMLIQSRRSIASKASCKAPFHKRRDFHHKTELFNNYRNQDDITSRKNSIKIKVRETLFNAKKLQRTSKLKERQSVESSGTKQNSRTSVFFSKRAMINFADKALRQEY